MKKYVLVIFMMILVLSCDHNSEVIDGSDASTSIDNYSIVFPEEYERADDLERRLIDRINAVVMALDRLNDTSYEAIVSVDDQGGKTIFANSIVIAQEESSVVPLGLRGGCKVCDTESAYRYIQVLRQIEGVGVEVYVKRDGHCVLLSW